MKIDASKLSPEMFDHLADLLAQCDLDSDLQLIAPETKKAGVASKSVVTTALKEELKPSMVEAGEAAPTTVVAVAKPVKVKKVVLQEATAETMAMAVDAITVKSAEEVDAPVVKKRGRPPLGGARMSDTEYKRRWREKQKSTRS